jgi:hypothetical protein
MTNTRGATIENCATFQRIAEHIAEHYPMFRETRRLPYGAKTKIAHAIGRDHNTVDYHIRKLMRGRCVDGMAVIAEFDLPPLASIHDVYRAAFQALIVANHMPAETERVTARITTTARPCDAEYSFAWMARAINQACGCAGVDLVFVLGLVDGLHVTLLEAA